MVEIKIDMIRQLHSAKDSKVFFDIFKKNYHDILSMFLSNSDIRTIHNFPSEKEKLLPDQVIDDLVSLFIRFLNKFIRLINIILFFSLLCIRS